MVVIAVFQLYSSLVCKPAQNPQFVLIYIHMLEEHKKTPHHEHVRAIALML